MVETPVWEGLGGGGRDRSVGELSQGTRGMRGAGESEDLTSRLCQ